MLQNANIFFNYKDQQDPGCFTCLQCYTLFIAPDPISTSVVDLDQHLCACPIVYCYWLLGAYLHIWISYHNIYQHTYGCYPITVNYAKGDQFWIQQYILVPAQELHSRAAPSVRGYHHSRVGPTTGRNPRGRQMKKKLAWQCLKLVLYVFFCICFSAFKFL